ncbi:MULTISPECIES: helix-turn-helix transcriptional regulator [unclassified Roseitalea]|uniref:helix-turn-helix domain-containing protein n=1 Tax=unclassified Roseitalea TaxID=2639107 RepID=UPI00273FB544|nr:MULTISPECIES: helix-turn-helix transcriptional regulator [unclassified Roseitalea]
MAPDHIDKRDASRLFRTRLGELLARSGMNRSRFAASVGLDRSALSQLLSGETTRLPRAETLIRLAARHGVSLDWLLGLSQDEGVSAAIKPALELEKAQDRRSDAMLARWHQEAAGTKIRYVPATIPDFLRTDRTIAYETRATKPSVAAQIDDAREKLAISRRPESDTEVCMPLQTLEALARGAGVWSAMDAAARAEQIGQIARLADDLYPGLRLFLFDGRRTFSAPYTVFGPYRAAVYVGDLYLVLNAKEAIDALTRHFDQLIRAATVRPHEAGAFIRSLPDPAAS